MTHAASIVGPELTKLYQLFPDEAAIPAHEILAPDLVPPPYHDLLVHPHHMTVAVERFYGQPVDVEVLHSRLDGHCYSRIIRLRLHDGSKVVQFGIVRIHLDCCSPPVRDKILEGKTPLGRVLIEHNVLRSIHPTAFLQVMPNAKLMEQMEIDEPSLLYGRLGVIFCDHRPAIEVLEILNPISE
ncbi:hypothetical protein [Tuwongella immobilis]|uniref:Uncharacterized protein n=1 Tax=Tuwongella immobilis TaxID=692036 RepID=A0A6C2YTK7_9BACT|nr:hypothetical protein [Tuwongella immobilis]VIP04677.1 Uncharacterized protein OS=Planctomyces maris DSM 8797 GN=PM8797T_21398 PE=4 SV=1 [Tuwongella immobilis]VTS06713.1 Uncharacterized protein OS=Planctomyces maris DSM 8797 GN=PM8797T_21398 PE=4 SV=1 [Tuwongella immobilis]